MNKKTLTIILCLVLLVSFFLPYLGNFSGFDLVFGKYKIIGSGSGIATILVPAGALIVLFGTLGNSSYSTGYWMPLVGIAFIIIMIFVKSTGSGIGDTISHFGYGLWLTLAASLILLFTKD